MISPKRSWGTIAAEFLVAKLSTETLKAFLNTVLAELWAERGSAPDWEKVYLRREDYELGIVPAKGSLLVAGVDVQDDRLEVEIKAYGRGKESWSVDYRVIQVPDQAGHALKTSSPEVWQELDALLATDWPCESGGTMPIMAMTIDTGFRPQMVYDFAARHPQPAHGPAGDRISAPRTVVADQGHARLSETDRAGVGARTRRASGRTSGSGTSARTGRSRSSTIGCGSCCPTMARTRPDTSTTPTRIRTSIAGSAPSRGSSGRAARWSGYRTSRSGTNHSTSRCSAARLRRSAVSTRSPMMTGRSWRATSPTDAPRPSSTDGYWGGRDDRWGTRGGDRRDWFK